MNGGEEVSLIVQEESFLISSYKFYNRKNNTISDCKIIILHSLISAQQ